ncbi:MAG: sodium/proline symporter [Coriobacteriales bacterium]|jgi:sodium/proline symporter|nr:sodium/proline symporter [Coriobacteriales bacterium]
MNGNNTAVLIAMALYVTVIIIIAFVYARRSNKSSEDYFLGGRRLGPWVAAMSAEASDMSGWLLMGLPGVAYFYGASEAAWTAIGLALGTYLNWRFVAKRLRKYSEKVGAITIPDFFSNRFHDKKKILMTVASLLILVFFSIYVGSCFVTTGKLFNALFGWDYFTLMVIGGIVVFVYTLLGGFLAESVSDFIQGTVMFFSLIIILVGGVAMAGGVDQVVAFVQSIPGFGSLVQTANPVLVDKTTQAVIAGMPQFAEAKEFGLVAIISTLAWGLGYFGMPQVLLRFMAIRSSREVGRARRIATSWCVVSLFSAVAIGLVGRALLPADLLTSSSAETIFISLATLLMPAFLAGIMMSGILAATMSSSDSYMLIASSAVAKNLFGGLLKRKATDRQVLVVARATMVAILLFGIFVAADANSSIFDVVAYAWAGFGAAFGPVMLAALFWRRVNLYGALAGMLCGGATIFIWRNLIKPLGEQFEVLGIYELLPGFIVGIVALVVVSLVTKPPAKAITDEFDTFMRLKA